MAVYTQVGAEDVAEFLARYDAGELVSLKGIAEGVENSNYFVETTKSRYILTLYEKRVDPNDLPFFHALLAHLHKAGCNVPRFISDSEGQWLQQLCGRPACLIEFLDGFSVSTPTAAQAKSDRRGARRYAPGAGGFHSGTPQQPWLRRIPCAGRNAAAAEKLDEITPGLATRIMAECDFVEANWPRQLATRCHSCRPVSGQCADAR